MKYLSFKEFVEKYGLKNETTSNVKIEEILDMLNLNSTGIYMRDDKFTTPSGIVYLHPTKGTHWVVFKSKLFRFIWMPTSSKHIETNKKCSLFRISNSEER